MLTSQRSRGASNQLSIIRASWQVARETAWNLTASSCSSIIQVPDDFWSYEYRNSL